MADRVGQSFGNYQLLRFLGRGAFAEVYLGEHHYLETPAAIKVLHVSLEPDTREQFRREAHTIAHLQHPHIVRVLDFGIWEQTPYLVMEFATGGTLRTLHPKGTRLPLEQIVTYVNQIAPALDYAHQQRVIHRDVKPENMLLSTQHEVVLSDFGIAFVQQTMQPLSTQQPAGTPLYMAPEQIRGKPCAASDQYALAVVVYEWLCGEPPFCGSLFEVYSQHLYQPPPGLCRRLPHLPPIVEDAVLGALAKDPQERFTSVQDFASVLEAACFATQPLVSRVLTEQKSQDQRASFVTLSTVMTASGTGEEDRSAETTQPRLMASQRREDEQEPIRLVTALPVVQSPTVSKQAGQSVAQRNRERLLRKVRSFWIAGVLEHSLHGAALIALGLQEQPDAVTNPWQLVLHHSDGAPYSLPAGTRITQVYDAANGELLILGAPGSGKTTLLLELTRDLLEQAEHDEHHPLPVVFNLSSWAKKQQPLTDWLVEELNSLYQVPRPLAQAWVDADQILPLLDGLDEVAPKDRTRCIEAINTYRQEHGLMPLVVCSRSADYLAQTARVRLGTAVAVQPLTQQQVDDYLAHGGEPLGALRVALHQDAVLRELASTPLMLSILTLTYQGMPIEDLLRRASLADRQRQIFEHYVERMLRHREDELRYPREQITQWLSWLARQMKQQSQTVFYIEHMQPDWLSGFQKLQTYDRWAIRFPGILIGMLISGILFSLSFNTTSQSLPPVVLFLAFIPYITLGGFIGWLMSAVSTTQQPQERSEKTRRGPWPRLLERLRVGVLIGLISGLSYGLVVWLNAGLISGLVSGLFVGLSYGLCSIALQSLQKKSSMAVSGFQIPRLSKRALWQSLVKSASFRNGITFGLLLGLSSGLISGLGSGLGFGLSTGLGFGLSTGLVSGLFFGLSAGLLSVLLIGKPIGISLADKLVWSWRGFGRSLLSKMHVITSLRIIALFGLIAGLSSGLSYGPSSVHSHGLIVGLSYVLIFGQIVGLSYGLIVGLSIWLLLGLFQGVSSETIEDQHRVVPNQGIRRSTRNSLVFGLISAGIAGLAIVLSSRLISGLSSGLSSTLLGFNPSIELIAGPGIGLLVGLLAGLLNGGLASLRHSLVRLLLWRGGSIPRNYPRFLDFAAERILLRKVGGGYIFVHRLLLEYFASLNNTSMLDEAKEEVASEQSEEPLDPDLATQPQSDGESDGASGRSTPAPVMPGPSPSPSQEHPQPRRGHQGLSRRKLVVGLIGVGCGLLIDGGMVSLCLPILPKEPGNLDFTSGATTWFLAGSNPEDYEYGIDPRVTLGGTPSSFLTSQVANPAGFGTMMQAFKGIEYRGKRLRLSGYVKAQAVEQWAGLWMRVDGPDPNKPLSFDNMEKRPIKGTRDWAKYEIVLDVPIDSVDIAFGILLVGKGRVWLSHLQLESVGKAVPTTAS